MDKKDVTVNFNPTASPVKPVTSGSVELKIAESQAKVEGELSKVSEKIVDVTAQLADTMKEKAFRTSVKRKAKITIMDDDGKREFISNGHRDIIKKHPKAIISMAINIDQIGKTGYLSTVDIEEFKNSPQFEFVNHGWAHQEPLNLTLEQLKNNYYKEKEKFIELGLGDGYDYYVYAGFSSDQVSNADLKNRLSQVYKCCLSNNTSKNAYIPFENYEVKRESAYAVAKTKEYIDFCIENGCWCNLFGHAWMEGQTAPVLDEILTYIDSKVEQGLIEYTTVKYMIDNFSTIIEKGNGVVGQDYFVLDNNGNVDFSIQGVPVNQIVNRLPVYNIKSIFSNKPITDYPKNTTSVELISYAEAVKFGLPDAGLIVTYRLKDNAVTTTETFHTQLYYQAGQPVTYSRQYKVQKDINCWFPFTPLSPVSVTTALRPRYSIIGTPVLDTTISKPIYSKNRGFTNNKILSRSTPYNYGDIIADGSSMYMCVAPGTTGIEAPTFIQDASFKDGTVMWVYVGVKAIWADYTGTVV